jgi:hypothetical protein
MTYVEARQKVERMEHALLAIEAKMAILQSDILMPVREAVAVEAALLCLGN